MRPRPVYLVDPPIMPAVIFWILVVGGMLMALNAIVMAMLKIAVWTIGILLALLVTYLGVRLLLALARAAARLIR